MFAERFLEVCVRPQLLRHPGRTVRAFTTSALTLLAMSFPWITAADVGGTHIGPTTGDPGVNGPALFTLVEAWNDTETPVVNLYYSANCFGFPYTPTHDFTLTRIEFFAGDLGGTVTVALLADDGSGLPTGPVLGSVTYLETTPRRWQGDDLSPSVTVHAGTLYYVRYEPVVSALLSAAENGVLIPHTYSFNHCTSWLAPVAPNFNWMARFYTDALTPARPHTWASLKITYR